MLTINLRLIAAIPVYLVAGVIALLAAWYQIMSVVSFVTLDLIGVVVTEVLSFVFAAVAAVVLMLARAIHGEDS